jgi:two-component system alkaline phosphatase synthesis response regulator PhoP
MMLPLNPNTLIVDDEANIRFFLRQALERSGHQISEACSGEDAYDMLRETFFDVAILDLNLGGKVDGLRILEAIRWRWPATVVIILTGYGTLESALSAIQEGIDGYLLKPVEASEVRKAIEDAWRRAQHRRAASDKHSENVLRHGGLCLDIARHCLEVDGRQVDLTPQEFRLMAYMLTAPHRTFSTDELAQVVQQYRPQDKQEARDLIKWYIHRLRKKVEQEGERPRFIINIRGAGYRLGDGSLT